MYKVKVYVTLRESVLDPQGKAVNHSLHSLNYQEVMMFESVNIWSLTIEKSDRDLDEVIKDVCKSYWQIRSLKTIDMK